MFRASMCPSSGEKLLYLCDTGICHSGLIYLFIYFSSLHVSDIHVRIIRRKIAASLRHWYLSLYMGGVWSGLIYLFISLLYMFRASMCPSSGEKLLYLCDTGICHSVWVASGLLVGLDFQSNQQKRCHPYRVKNTSFAKIQQFFS